jgi:hypothetical protein
MNLATTSLNAMGDQHDVIHGNTRDSMWLRQIIRFAPFAVEWYSDSMSSNGTIGYGKTSELTAEIPKSGDLLRNIVAHLIVNPLTDNSTLGPAPALCEFFPYMFFNQLRVLLGGQRLLEIDGIEMAVIYMLQTPEDLHMGYAVGAGSLSTRQYLATFKQEFLAPFAPFLWFSHFVLPIIALGKTNVTMRYTTAKFDTVVQHQATALSLTSPGDSPSSIQGSIHTAEFLYEYIFVTADEQESWQTHDHEYAVQVWQRQEFSVSSDNNSAAVTDELVFSNPVTELIVWCRLDSRNTTDGTSDLLNFTAHSTGSDNLQLHPFADFDLRYSNNGLQWNYTPAFCEKLMPYLHHTRVPRGNAKVYVIPFADRPESWYQLSTATDFTQIHKVIFRATLAGQAVGSGGTATVHVLARCINRFRIANKTGGLMWA